MDAYLIDPFAQTITKVNYSGRYEQIYDLIDCDTFDCARINRMGDAIFIDDEGLMRERPQAFFRHRSYPQPLAGKGLVLGGNDEGESTAPAVSLEQLIEDVEWVMPAKINGEVTWIHM